MPRTTQLHIGQQIQTGAAMAQPLTSPLGRYQLMGISKPDVTLPGGMIYSSVNNGEYYVLWEPAMASLPCAAGATVLVKQALKERFLILAQNNYRF